MSFAPDSLRAQSSRFGTYGVLGIGIASAIALMWVAWGPLIQPDEVGRRRFQDWKAEAEDEVRRGWAQLNSDRELLKLALGLKLDMQAIAPEFWKPALAPAGNEAAAWLSKRAKRAPNFDLLMSESERHEFQTGDLDRAISACRDAIRVGPDPVREAEAQLRLLQLLLKAEKPEQALHPWKWMVRNLKGHESIGDLSILGIGYLVLGHSNAELGAELLANTRGKINETLQAHRLQIPDAGLVVKRGKDFGILELEIGASTQRLEQLMVNHRFSTQGLAANATKFFLLHRLTASFEKFGVKEIPTGASLHTGAEYTACTFRSQGTDALLFGLVDSPSLPAKLKKHLAPAIGIDQGFTFDVLPATSLDQSKLANSVSLPCTNYRVVVSHPDPEAIRKRAETPIQFLRWGLSLLGLLTLATSLAIHRAVRRQQRLQQLKTDFVANVSHELRTPISSILLMAENLENQLVADSESISRYHRLIRREAVRLRRLVADILDFSRLNHGELPAPQLATVQLDQWQHDLSRELVQWSKDHQIELRLMGNLPAKEAVLDAESIRRAIFNLADNAKRHSGSSKVDLLFTSEANQLSVQIRDYGTGLAKGSERRIFEPFQQASSQSVQGKGAGLGLAIVAQIVQSHGGEVSAANATGGGAEFTITLPTVTAIQSP
jgi:signal transduction histidine kinase